ncbi:MAG: porin [Roseibacillus sp.]
MKKLLFPAVALLASISQGKEAFDYEPEVFENETSCWASDFCEWWSDDPGEIYRNKKNPWIEKVQLSGKFHYQFGRVEGEDVRGTGFDHNFVEFRRARVAAEIDFLKYFELEVGINLVDDRRYRVAPENSLDWGHDTFDTVALEFNLGDALGKGPFDEIKLSYGRIKLKLSEEVHTSSNNLKAIERSNLSDLLGGAQSRPTGFTIELEKADWTAVLGVFSNEDSSDLLADWDDGVFYYGSLEWQISDEWILLLDHAQTNPTRTSNALGYNHGTSLALTYDSRRWGVTTNLIYGQNSDDELRNPLREGDFYGGVFTPWVWVLKDRLQLVGRYHYARSEQTEGLRLQNRYVRGRHLPPTTDLDGGYGDELHSFYVGLNLHLCEDSIQLMSGVSHDLMSARTNEISATTYTFAFRTAF